MAVGASSLERLRMRNRAFAALLLLGLTGCASKLNVEDSARLLKPSEEFEKAVVITPEEKPEASSAEAPRPAVTPAKKEKAK